MRVNLRVLRKPKWVLSLLVSCLLVGGIGLYTRTPPAILESTRAPHLLIMPHHDLIQDRFSKQYEQVPKIVRENTKTIYLFSPNHYFTEDIKIIRPDSALVESKIKKDHGVQIHLPLITHYFPNAKVIPYLFTRHVTREELDLLLKDLRRYQNDSSVFFIASVDFSHGLPISQAMTQDTLTMEMIKQHDLDSVLRLQDKSLDCPSCLYLALELFPPTEKSIIPLFHGNSAQFLQLSPDAVTTSYFVFAW